MKKSTTRIPWQRFSLKALTALARTLGIPGRTTMKKDELISVLKKEARASRKTRNVIAQAASGSPAPSQTAPVPSSSRPKTKKSEPTPVSRETRPPAETYIDRGKAIPMTYNRDILRLMVRDPEWLFVYWELTPACLQKLHARYPSVSNRTWHLKVIDDTFKSESFVAVFLGACNWYVNVSPRRTYRVELGFTHGDDFVSVLSSNSCSTPGNNVSDRGDEEWMILRRDLMRLMHLSSEKDLFGADRPHTSAERYMDITSEQLELIQSQARKTRSIGASSMPRSTGRKQKK